MDLTEEEPSLLYKIRASLKTYHYLNPLNFEEEKYKFFKLKKYNPQFIYPDVPSEKFKKFEEILIIKPFPNADSLSSYIKGRKIEETLLKLKLILSIGKSDISLYSKLLYQLKFDRKTIDCALKDSKISSSFKSQEKLNQSQTVNKFCEYLNKNNLNNWQVTKSERSDFYFQVLHQSRLISVGKNLNWDYCNIDNTLAHEIDGHVIRSINAKKQKKKAFQANLPFYIKTEEGLACYLGDYCAKDGQTSLKHHAIKYLAGYFALSNSFYETYNFLIDHGFTKELAFQRTFRLKRGLTDTSMPGCFAREAMYYEGMVEVKDYLDGGGDIRKLYLGKVGLEYIDIVPIPENQVIPQRIRNYLN